MIKIKHKKQTYSIPNNLKELLLKDFQKIKSLKDDNNMISENKLVELQALKLFQSINELGNYSDAQWFLNLDKLSSFSLGTSVKFTLCLFSICLIFFKPSPIPFCTYTFKKVVPAPKASSKGLTPKIMVLSFSSFNIYLLKKKDATGASFSVFLFSFF